MYPPGSPKAPPLSGATRGFGKERENFQVCHKCEEDIDAPCDNCGQDKEVIFRYEGPDDSETRVIDDFVQYVLTDPTMDNR